MADTTNKEKRTINRSTAYPGVTLEKAIEATKQLRENLGSGPYSRDSAATALGYATVSGASTQKIGACVHFGLLTRKNNAYSQSSLADQVFRHISEEERLQAIKDAAQKPALYSKLIAEFNGKALPKMLDNLLVRNYGITERVAKDVAAAFTKSMKFAGILENGIITLTATSAPVAEAGEDEVADDDTTVVEGQLPQVDQGRASKNPGAGVQNPPAATPGYIPVPIPDTDVKILFPMDYAYELGIGKFTAGIEALSKSIKEARPVTPNDEPPIIA